MPGRVNGSGRRVVDLDGARSSRRRPKGYKITPGEVLALIDQVFVNYGLDPNLFTDPSGWRHLMLGSVEGAVGVVQWQPGDYHLVVFAPMFGLPDEPDQLTHFYRILLELNHHHTSSARFSINDNHLFLSISRPIRGLDEEEVDDAIRSVMVIADSYDEGLLELLGVLPMAMPELPNIKIKPNDAKVIGAVLARCDPHGQAVFRYAMKRWDRMGNIVEPGINSINLKVQLDDKTYSIAGMIPGFGETRQRIIFGWEGLRKKKIYPSEAIEKFQTEALKISEISTTESNAHIEVTETFDRESTKSLLRALSDLAKAANPELDVEEKVEWDPNLPDLDIEASARTLNGIQETLQACEPRVQKMYAEMIQSWANAGGKIECVRPGRIYLKLKTAEHEYGKYGKRSHTFNIAVLAAPRGKRGPTIDVAWNLSSGDYAYLNYVPQQVQQYEGVVSELPGFGKEGTVNRLTIDDAFTEEHVSKLLEGILDLKEASSEKS